MALERKMTSFEIRDLVLQSCKLVGIDERRSVLACNAAVTLFVRHKKTPEEIKVEFCPMLPDFTQDYSKWRFVTASEMLRRLGVRKPTTSQAIAFGKWVRQKYEFVEVYKSNGRKLMLLPTEFIDQEIL